MLIDVLIEHAFLGNQTLTYDATGFTVHVGTRVLVTINNREVIGFVVRVHQEMPNEFEVVSIVGVIDAQPIINEELDQLAHMMSNTTVSPLIRCYQTLLPNKLAPRSSAKPIKMQKVLVRTDKPVLDSLTSKQHEFIDTFGGSDAISLKDASRTYSGYRKLVELGYYEVVEREVRYAETVVERKERNYELTDQQQAVVDAIILNQAEITLIHGVTGSGKTEIYLSLASKVLKDGKQVLILVPEISLTPQMIERVSMRFGEDVAIYHSALNDQEKYEQFCRVRDHEVNIVVGTRSSVFLPFRNLGLIVMDEEHDTSYKQENIPFYHTRDIAKWRSEYHQCPLVLGSASPSLETYARALRGVYQLLELPSRINDAFPSVEIVDTKKALYNRESPYITNHLEASIEACLKDHKQCVLLLNRRGYMTLLKDRNDEVIQCRNCDVALNFHKDDGRMHCHMCGYQSRLSKDMKVVGSGVGTQRLEEAIKKRFPQARVLRMDADTTSRKHAHESILRQFMNQEADILIGTQMIAKGLDNENVTLVGIVNADAALTYTDYRAVELTFQMMLQASGRSGRGKYPGKVVIQTANPNHYAIQCAIHQKYKHFFKQEMQYRKLASYPPYSFLIAITFTDESESKSLQRASKFVELINDKSVQVLGPTQLRKLVRKHRCRVLLRGKDLDSMIQMVHNIMDVVYPSNRTGVIVDVNPLTLE